MSNPRSAIVIGVNKTGGGLPVLHAAAKNAREVADWLAGEGFAVTALIDAERGPQGPGVGLNDIVDAVEAVIATERCTQLVIYFGGHGFLKSYSEYWLLSRAPERTTEAVNVAASVELARSSGIPHVVFISDACRSTASSLQAQHIEGGSIFPNRCLDPGAVDRFFAARPGQAALEVADGAAAWDALYTRAMRNAFKNPRPDLVSHELVGGAPTFVITNWRLRAYLPGALEAALRDHGVMRPQNPDGIIESGEHTFIAHIDREALAKLAFNGGGTRSGVAPWEARAGRLRSLPLATIFPSFADAIGAEASLFTDEHPRFVRDVEQTRAAAPEALPRGTGFAIFGAGTDPVAECAGVRCVARAAGQLVHVEVAPDALGSVVVRLAGTGHGVVLAALPGYVGRVEVRDGTVASVGYIPAEDGGVAPLDADRAAELEDLRANVAAATRRGVFVLTGQRDGALEALVRAIRLDQRLDPALAVYAAHAYALGGQRAAVRSLLERMGGDLQGALLDLRLLAGDAVDPVADRRVAPCAPMLSQAWPLLPARPGTRLPPAVLAAGADLVDALWTTFGRRGTDILMEAAHKGELG